ncbi:MAG TPA: ABC transporter permease subunit [Solirubrobacteraceae bacterium]|nr:ABC transporter permease subunit [Solirubrobacteraceae bacterium]
MSATSAIARRALADSRVRNASYAALFALVAYAQAIGYRNAYPTIASRLAFARAFGDNASVRLFYGKPYDLLTVGGYSAWRVGGLLAIFAGIWGILASVRALRGEEDAGRSELVLAAPITRGAAYAAMLVAVGAGALALWAAIFVGLLSGRLAAGGSAYLALATVAPAFVFAGVGAVASQLAPTRRLALELGSAALVVALLLRVIADTASGLEWLRWVTPLGWSEEMRAFTGTHAAVLALPLAAGTLLLLAAGKLALRRDVGSGVLRERDEARTRLRLLSSPTALALREERGSLAGWLLGVGLFALIVGLISTSISKAGVSAALQRQLQKLGGVSVIEPAGYIGFSFLFFVLAISLFCASQLAAARHEEAEERLETLFAQPVDRRRWLAGRIALALGGAAVLSLTAGVLAWAGAALQGADVTFASMLEAGANCLPVALLFGGLAALAFALAPRAGVGVGYGLIAAAFVWQLLSGLLEAPAWLRELSPFEHVGLVPAQDFKALAALVMLALAATCSLSALWLFRRRDLTGV